MKINESTEVKLDLKTILRSWFMFNLCIPTQNVSSRFAWKCKFKFDLQDYPQITLHVYVFWELFSLIMLERPLRRFMKALRKTHMRRFGVLSHIEHPRSVDCRADKYFMAVFVRWNLKASSFSGKASLRISRISWCTELCNFRKWK